MRGTSREAGQEQDREKEREGKGGGGGGGSREAPGSWGIDYEMGDIL